MKGLAKVLLICGLVAATLTTVAVAQAPTSIVVDEFGLGTIGGAPLPPGVPTPDPFNGGALQLAYTLPFIAAGGPFDILVTEPGGPTAPLSVAPLSDILRFVPGLTAAGTTTLFFYSDGSDGIDAPADVPFLPPNIVAAGVFEETGLLGPGMPGPYTEAGPNGLVYIAAPGAPGWDGANPIGTQYTFISDVPEPGTFVLVGLGVVGLLAMIRRRR
jgi:hypothetical protein